MSKVSLENAPQMTTPVNYEGHVKSALQEIMDRVEETSNPKQIVRASLDVKRIFKTAFNEGPQDKAFQRRISDLFCSARETLGLALTQATVERRS